MSSAHAIDNQRCVLADEGCHGEVRFGACDHHAPILLMRMTFRTVGQQRREPMVGHPHERRWLECEKRGLNHPCEGTVREFLCDRHREGVLAQLGLVGPA